MAQKMEGYSSCYSDNLTDEKARELLSVILKNIFSLIRITNYVKNLIIFLAPMLTHQLFMTDSFFRTSACFMIFLFTASIVYIINDIKDAESDCRPPLKCKRPIASGKISSRSAVIIAVFLFIALICIWSALNFESKYIILPFVYLTANLLYNVYLKNIPLLDVLILVFCYTARLWYGASSRKSLKGCTVKFLDKAMLISMTSAIVFYSLMCSDLNTSVASSGVNLLWTAPFITVICLRYLMLVESDSCDGDPVSVILGDKVLLYK